jgi:hypothetical protein
MPKAHITTAYGTKIIIEGDTAEVVAVVNQIQALHPPPKRGGGRISKANEEKRERKKQDSAKDHIVSLKEEGFFDKPKSLSEVAKKLEESGHLYPVTTLSGVVLGLVQKRLLARVKRDSKWMYGKR